MNDSMKRMLMLLVWAVLACGPAFAQKTAVTLNMADYMMLGTLNVGAGVSVARHWTLEAAAKYNPFSYGPEENRMQNRQQVYNAGVRYWPWHVFSGWWISAKVSLH